MWDQIVGALPNKLILLCTILSFLIPYIIYKINAKLHGFGDPPWKREEDKEPPSPGKE